ncbi:hypothetical protein BJ138DRAFT_1163293 [Hygrophoropsis aurantiaca]|uniref:Uncharacterized protein n=1 Tax=Hygrophoropsis aurantiaca TaxID=72124 RepID=A0ACB7ZZE9_9AGAM|nr:hypothetical protein BJ138DRAFT_1163293 [Hygrophoropsis aurantiaca]
MSVVTPTLIPRPLIVPLVLPNPPQPNPAPLPKANRFPGRMNNRRDLQHEMDDLSDEENELEEINMRIRNQGFDSIIPIGRVTTQMEEKNDAEDDDDDSDTGQSGGGAPSVTGEENDDSGPDLDASMEDMDEEEGNITAETDEVDEGNTEEYEDDF